VFTLFYQGWRSALLQNLRKFPRNSKIQENLVNQGDHDDINRQSNHSNKTKYNVENIQSVGKGPKQDLEMETKIEVSSLVESPISVVGESPCGQVDSLLVSRLLRPRQKSS
jgi:hypothetical protein